MIRHHDSSFSIHLPSRTPSISLFAVSILALLLVFSELLDCVLQFDSTTFNSISSSLSVADVADCLEKMKLRYFEIHLHISSNF